MGENKNRDLKNTSANIALNDNGGQMNKIGEKLFKSRPSKKGAFEQVRPFLHGLG